MAAARSPCPVIRFGTGWSRIRAASRCALVPIAAGGNTSRWRPPRVRILFINRMMGVSWGGGENYDYHLARALQQFGREVMMLTGKSARWPVPPPKDLECVSIETPYLRRYMYSLAGKV